MKKLALLSLILLSCGLLAQVHKLGPYSDTIFKVGDRFLIYHPTYSTYGPLDRSPEIDSLKPVAEFLKKHPNIIFELESHTDGRGTPAKNLQLSKLRAVDYKNCLIKYYQTDSTQLVPKGYGSLQLLIRHEEMSPEYSKEEKEILYGKNRRTVLRVLKFR